MKKKTKIISFCVAGILFLGIGEIALRELLGMGNAPLYFTSSKYEYMACPNQDGYRYGNHYHYNSFISRLFSKERIKNINNIQNTISV